MTTAVKKRVRKTEMVEREIPETLDEFAERHGGKGYEVGKGRYLFPTGAIAEEYRRGKFNFTEPPENEYERLTLQLKYATTRFERERHDFNVAQAKMLEDIAMWKKCGRNPGVFCPGQPELELLERTKKEIEPWGKRIVELTDALEQTPQMKARRKAQEEAYAQQHAKDSILNNIARIAIGEPDGSAGEPVTIDDDTLEEGK